ncbi:hypothetical protein LTS08_007946 [Lithohypha guttulata]|nr:hypothetical protein LTS08_007946 [Lithohypha guttulata]
MGQKRRRIALSCVDCRRRKVKCDRTLPSCIRCQKGGNGNKCSYVTYTGSHDAPSEGHTSSDPERSRRSRASSHNTWRDEAEQYESTAHNNANAILSVEAEARPTPVQVLPRSGPIATDSSTAPTDYRYAQLRNRLIELETWVYAAGGKPTSKEMNLGLLNPVGPGAAGERNPYSDEYAIGDQEKVLLQGKSFKTKYFGPSNTLSILLQFEDLSKFVKEILLALPCLQDAKYSISKIRQREKHAAKQPYDISIESLIAMVPEKSYADRLLHHYLDTVETTYRIVHVPTLLKDYEAYWRSPKDTNPGFVVQLLVAMSMMGCIVPGGEEGFVGRSSAKRELASHWINVCNYWLECQSQKHVSLLIYQLHIQLFLSKALNCIKVKRFWTDSGALVRRFMAAGLHREPTLLCNRVNTFDCEMRRRLWYTALEIDLQVTLDRGMTPTIGSMDWDTNPPSNIDDEDLNTNASALPDPKPRSTFTRSSYLAWAAESLPLRIDVLYKVNSIRNALDHDTITMYDHKIRLLLDDIPIAGWREAAIRNSPQHRHQSTLSDLPASTLAPPSSLLISAPGSLVPLTLSQCILREYLVVLHQPFPTNREFKQAHFHSRISRRYACITNILLYNPQLSIADATGRCTVPAELQLSSIQRRFFAFIREDFGRSALSLAHSFVVATSPSHNTSMLHVTEDRHLIDMIEAVVNMLDDRVRNLGQGFHGYWIISSALSFVHSKQNPDVPRSHFARAAADRVFKLHSYVMGGQLPRAKRLILPMPDRLAMTSGDRRSVSPESVAMNEGSQRKKQRADGVMRAQMHQPATSATTGAGVYTQDPNQNIHSNGEGLLVPDSSHINDAVGTLNYTETTATTTVPMNNGTQDDGFMDDMLLGLDEWDWTQVMSIDPTGFMMGTLDYAS